jgi:hypothetical protein
VNTKGVPARAAASSSPRENASRPMKTLWMRSAPAATSASAGASRRPISVGAGLDGTWYSEASRRRLRRTSLGQGPSARTGRASTS